MSHDDPVHRGNRSRSCATPLPKAPHHMHPRHSFPPHAVESYPTCARTAQGEGSGPPMLRTLKFTAAWKVAGTADTRPHKRGRDHRAQTAPIGTKGGHGHHARFPRLRASRQEPGGPGQYGRAHGHHARFPRTRAQGRIPGGRGGLGGRTGTAPVFPARAPKAGTRWARAVWADATRRSTNVLSRGLRTRRMCPRPGPHRRMN